MFDSESFTKLPENRRRDKAIRDFKLILIEYKVNYSYRFETAVWINKDYPPGDDRAYHSFKFCLN